MLLRRQEICFTTKITPGHCERGVWVRDKADMIGGGAGIYQIARFTVTGENEAWS